MRSKTAKIFNGIDEITTGDLGTSDWLLVDQERVNTFADATGDHQWIHVDPERAATPNEPLTVRSGAPLRTDC